VCGGGEWMDGRTDGWIDFMKVLKCFLHFFSFPTLPQVGKEYARGRTEPAVRVPTPLVQIKK